MPEYDNKILNKWQQLYDSKFGHLVRDFFNGQDSDLSDEEYVAKHGYYKPVGSLGVAGMVVAPEWEELEIPEITSMHRGFQGKPQWINTIEKYRMGNYTKPAEVKQLSNFDKFLQKSVEDQNSIVRYWNGERFSSFDQLKRDKKALSAFKEWLKKKK